MKPGDRFARLTLISIVGYTTSRHAIWLCQCDCGIQKAIEGTSMRTGNTQSCGCLRDEVRKKGTNFKHGGSIADKPHPLYSTWRNMHRRCYSEVNKDYVYYGGRGIQICERWHEFAHFVADMGERPKGLTLDRINNNGNYEPSNCRWATPTEQYLNSRKGNMKGKR